MCLGPVQCWHSEHLFSLEKERKKEEESSINQTNWIPMKRQRNKRDTETATMWFSSSTNQRHPNLFLRASNKFFIFFPLLSALPLYLIHFQHREWARQVNSIWCRCVFIVFCYDCFITIIWAFYMNGKHTSDLPGEETIEVSMIWMTVRAQSAKQFFSSSFSSLFFHVSFRGIGYIESFTAYMVQMKWQW